MMYTFDMKILIHAIHGFGHRFLGNVGTDLMAISGKQPRQKGPP